MELRIEDTGYCLNFIAEIDNAKLTKTISLYTTEKKDHVDDETIEKFIEMARDVCKYNNGQDDVSFLLKVFENCYLSPGEQQRFFESIEPNLKSEGYEYSEELHEEIRDLKHKLDEANEIIKDYQRGEEL